MLDRPVYNLKSNIDIQKLPGTHTNQSLNHHRSIQMRSDHETVIGFTLMTFNLDLRNSGEYPRVPGPLLF